MQYRIDSGTFCNSCADLVGLSSIYLRTGDTKGKEVPGAQPIDGSLGYMKVLGSGG